MTDLIVKKAPLTPEELTGRGAIAVNDEVPGQGFQEDDTHDPRYDDPEVVDCEKRAEDAQITEQVNEETQRMHEENANAVRNQRLPNQDDYLDWVPGRILNLGDFMALLQKIRPDAFVAEYQIMGLRGLGFIQDGKAIYSGTSLQDTSVEWSQLRLTRWNTAYNERYRGWRTVLLNCINKGFITVEQCDETFGKPTGPRSKPWYRELWRIRNDKCGVCMKAPCICTNRYDFLRSDKNQYTIPDSVAQGKQQRLEESRIWTP